MDTLDKIHKHFRHIIFTDSDHTYYDTINKKSLISCTTFIGKYSQTFQEEYWSKKKADERGITVKEILKEWEDKRIYGQQKGTLIHKMCEDLVQRKKMDYTIPEIVNTFTTEGYKKEDFIKEVEQISIHVHDYFKTFNEILIQPELVVGNKYIAGQIDLPVKSKIIDFKTDKKITFSNKYQRFKYPIDHLEESKFNKYSLQLSIYRYILEQAEIIFKQNNTIIWFNKEGYEIIELPYLKDEVIALFNHSNFK